MVVKSATKKRLMDNGVPESVAHSLADDRPMEKVRELRIHQIADIAYDYLLKVSVLPVVNEWNPSQTTSHILDQSRIIFYLIDPSNRKLPQVYQPPSAHLGVLNWWWGEDKQERISQIIRDFTLYHGMTIAELKELLKAKGKNTAGKKTALITRLMEGELE